MLHRLSYITNRKSGDGLLLHSILIYITLTNNITSIYGILMVRKTGLICEERSVLCMQGPLLISFIITPLMCAVRGQIRDTMLL